MISKEEKFFLEKGFPGLKKTAYRKTSSIDPRYNCHAHAAGLADKFMFPPVIETDGVFWPAGAPKEYSPAAFIKAFETFGFFLCENGERERGVEKLTLYIDSGGAVTHTARQLKNGKWTSKLGKNVDIEHTLEALDGEAYGTRKIFLKRAFPTTP